MTIADDLGCKTTKQTKLYAFEKKEEARNVSMSLGPLCETIFCRDRRDVWMRVMLYAPPPPTHTHTHKHTLKMAKA